MNSEQCRTVKGSALSMKRTKSVRMWLLLKKLNLKSVAIKGMADEYQFGIKIAI